MPTSVVGAGLAVLLLCLVAAALWLVWRRPFVGLGVLVAGMAFHNFVLMVLLELHTPPLLIRVVQGWKELVLATLGVLAVTQLLRTPLSPTLAPAGRGRLRRLIPMDWVAIAFTVVLIVYVLLPASVVPASANFVQRVLAFRTAALIPLIYFLARVFSRPKDRDLEYTGWLIVGAGAVVGAFGLYELWFVPTARWLDWGVNLFSSWLGFTYNGPAGLPENFFQSLPDGLLLRRMVSTYISPLGIAYTGLIAWPIAVVMLDRRQPSRLVALLTSVAAGLLLLGILFSVTRLALLMLAGESFVLLLVLRTKVVLALGVLVIASVTAILFLYPSVGPTVDPYLLPGESHHRTILYIGDPSFAEHLRALVGNLRFISQHPLGTGLGGSVNRFIQTGASGTTGESALLGFFGDIGVVGGGLFLALYGLSLYYGRRAVRVASPRSLRLALPLVASVGGLVLLPIALTSDVWADFSVSFLYWWAAGYSASIALPSDSEMGPH